MSSAKFYDEFYTWLINSGIRVVTGIIVFFVGIWLVRILKSRLRKVLLKSKVNSSIQPFIFSLSIPALYVLLILLVIDILGLQLTMFTTIIGAFSVAVGLSLS